jgi:hypothetical protein
VVNRERLIRGFGRGLGLSKYLNWISPVIAVALTIYLSGFDSSLARGLALLSAGYAVVWFFLNVGSAFLLVFGSRAPPQDTHTPKGPG